MSDELQKHLDGTSRAAVEADLVLWEIGTNVASGFEELITLISEGPDTFLHFPSLERLDDFGTPSTSGAALIGVSGDNFTNLTGDTDLQTVLDEIDTLLATGVTGAILKTGAVAWDAGVTQNCGFSNFNSMKSLEIDYDSVDGTADNQVREAISVLDGDIEILDTDAVSATIFGSAGVSVTGDFASSGTYPNQVFTYTHSAGSGTVYQSSGAWQYSSIGKWFRLTYTIASPTGDVALTAEGGGTEFVDVGDVSMPVTVGTHEIAFRMNNAATAFTISATSTSGGLVLSAVSVKEIIGGDLILAGKLRGTPDGPDVMLDEKGIQLNGASIRYGALGLGSKITGMAIGTGDDVAMSQGLTVGNITPVGVSNEVPVHGYSIVEGGNTTTTDTTPKDIVSVMMGVDDSIMMVKIHVSAIDSGGTMFFNSERNVMVNRASGVTSIQSNQAVTSSSIGGFTGSISPVASTNTMKVRITGMAATTIRWDCRVVVTTIVD